MPDSKNHVYAVLTPPPATPTPVAAASDRSASRKSQRADADNHRAAGFDDCTSGIANRILVINDAKALVHIVVDTVYLVSPGIFQRYAQESPNEKLALHRKQENGLNLWNCGVAGTRKTYRLHGYLLKDPKCLFDEAPPNNPHLALVQGTGETRTETPA